MNGIERAAAAKLALAVSKTGESTVVARFLNKYGPVRTRGAYANHHLYYFR